MISQILPLLNRALPAYFSVKGLEKVNPRLSNFFQASAAAGYGTHEALDYLRGTFSTDTLKNEVGRLQARGSLRPDEASALQRIQSSHAPANALSNLSTLAGAGTAGYLAQRSAQAPSDLSQEPQPSRDTASQFAQMFPDLHDFITSEVSKGRSPEQAGALARADRNLSQSIQLAERQYQSKWSQILAKIYGSMPTATAAPQDLNRQGSNAGAQALLSAIQAYKASKGQ